MKKIPEFKNEADERAVWATADSTEYIDWRAAQQCKPLTRRAARGDQSDEPALP